MFNLLLFVVAFSLPMIIRAYMKEIEKPPWVDEVVASLVSHSNLVISLSLLLFIVILGLISYLLSIIAYKKREF